MTAYEPATPRSLLPATLLACACAALYSPTARAQVPPILTINDASVVEGNAGQTNLVFTVSLQGGAAQPVSAQFEMPTPLTGAAFHPATRGATSCVGGADFLSNQVIAVHFPSGASPPPVTISVPVCGDTVVEPNEQMFVNLTQVNNAQCLEGTCNGIGTIIDDDGPPVISIADTSVREPLRGTVKASFIVTLAHTSLLPVDVNYATRDVSARSTSTALAGQPVTCPMIDYLSKSGTLRIEPGQHSGQIDVSVCSDTANEASETFTVQLSGAVNGVLGDASATGTIINLALPTQLTLPN